MNYAKNKIELEENGYSVLDRIYSDSEIDQILSTIENASLNGNSFTKTEELFALRRLIKEVPELAHLLFNKSMNELICELSGSEYFLTKAIYFDKPCESNWFVAYHQDLSISVDQKTDLEDYSNWTLKKGQYGVQPPIEVLQDTTTIRIHLDKTSKDNGALKLIPKSHRKGIIRHNSKYWNTENEYICEVEKGGVMLMKPLTLHASNRTKNGKRRRVIHLEFNKHKLAEPLNWSERFNLRSNTAD